MEHRFDLEHILLNGLPEHERLHTVKVMRQVTAANLRRKQAEGVRDNEPINIGELDAYDEELV